MGKQMTRESFYIFASVLRTYFSKEKLLPNEQAMELWYEALEDVPIDLAETFLKQWVANNDWSPSIHQIRQGCMNIAHGESETWDSQYSLIKKLIGQYGRDREELAVKKLNPIAQEVVKNLGWKNICNEPEENEMAFRANFRDCYNIASERLQAKELLPESVRKQIDLLSGGFKQLEESQMEQS